MLEHTAVRDLPIPPDDAYAWLTDYREDDMREVMGDPSGTRKLQRLPDGRLHLETIGVIAGVKGRADGVITFSPPDSWSFDGHIAALGRKMVHVDSRWRVEPHGDRGTRFTASFRVTPVHLLARLYLRFRSRKARAMIEEDYDRIAAAIAKEFSGPSAR